MQKKFEQASAHLSVWLRSNGMRQTQERLMVLEQVCTYDRHFTADQLAADLEGNHLSLGTVYNSLQLFEQCGLIHRLNPAQGSRRSEYELTFGNDHTMRFLCTRCGREASFRDKAIESILREKRFSNFSMDNFVLTVYGTCKVCRSGGRGNC
ncbi:MAG: transcriptional repressor [Paludibacteraceae bacterium]|nr:transcriptional repressor [Paludibacteraceae bacterium]